MEARPRSWWLQIKQHPFIAIGVIVALFALIFAVLTFGWDWTGFTGGESKVTTTMITPGMTTTTTPRATVAIEQQPAKTLWDWLGLLAALAIPVVVGLGTAWFTAQQGKVSDRENKDNQREAALQGYIDKISKLLLKEHLGELTTDGKLKPEYTQVRKIARVRTLTVLLRLDAGRKASVLRFLQESGLIGKDKYIIDLRNADLSEADLSEADLSEADLFRANLSRAKLSGDLSEANLSEADLSEADLSGANLNGTILFKAKLSGAYLSEADLSGLNLSEADLSGLNLSEADLSGANLSGANLSGARLLKTHMFDADISGANLSGANLSEALLDFVHLSGANLSGANLSGTDLFRADLSGAKLSGAKLSGGGKLSGAHMYEANLRGAFITSEELGKAFSLNGAILPDGTKHP